MRSFDPGSYLHLQLRVHALKRHRTREASGEFGIRGSAASTLQCIGFFLQLVVAQMEVALQHILSLHLEKSQTSNVAALQAQCLKSVANLVLRFPVKAPLLR